MRGALRVGQAPLRRRWETPFGVSKCRQYKRETVSQIHKLQPAAALWTFVKRCSRPLLRFHSLGHPRRGGCGEGKAGWWEALEMVKAAPAASAVPILADTRPCILCVSSSYRARYQSNTLGAHLCGPLAAGLGDFTHPLSAALAACSSSKRSQLQVGSG